MKKLTTRWYYSLLEFMNATFTDSGEEDDYPFLDIPPVEGLGELCYDIADYFGAMSTERWKNLDTTQNKKMWANYLWPEYGDATIFYVDQLVNPWELNNEVPPTDEELWEELKPILPRIVRWLEESTERYSVLIDAYEQIENNLLARVATVTEASGINNQTSSGETSNTGSSSGNSTVNGENSSVKSDSNNELALRNDTPQNGGNFTTDPYVSEASKKDVSTHSNQLDQNISNTTTSTSDSSASLNSNISKSTSASESVVSTDLTTPIERLDEVRKKLHNLYTDWADEFAQFVIYAD